MKAVVNTQVIQIALSGDTMTHPGHRKKGLFIILALLTYDECRKNDFQLLIGQPNENSCYGLVNKLGWSHLDDIVRRDLKQKIKTLPLYKISRKLRFLSGLYSANVKAVLRKYTVPGVTTYQNPLSSAFGKIWRDEKYLAYKKSDDKYFIKINRCGSWIRLTDIFWIGDFDNYEAIDNRTIQQIKKLARWLGYNTISFNLNRSVPLQQPLTVFKEYSSQASCFLYFNETYKNQNFILTAADSDTW